MSLLKIETAESASGSMKEVFDQFMKGIGAVPKTLQLFSASPELFARQMSITQYFRNHKTLGFPLLCLIRYLAASECRNNICININRALLKRQGMTDEEIEELRRDVTSAPLEDRENALLEFVVNTSARPDSASEADIDKLRKLGWSDADILDATYQAALMVTTGLLSRIFKID